MSLTFICGALIYLSQKQIPIIWSQWNQDFLLPESLLFHGGASDATADSNFRAITLASYDPAHGRVVKAHVITDFFEGVMVDDMRSMDRPISG
jgi:hypothetical protein